MVTRDKCQLIPSSIDPEFCCRREKGELVCLMTKHVDDLKVAGRPDVVQQVLAEIQRVFGELKILWKDFTNCGVRHIQAHEPRKLPWIRSSTRRTCVRSHTPS